MPEELDEGQLESVLYPGESKEPNRPLPDLEYIHRELRRKHVTLMLLWLEYKKAYPESGDQYTTFCSLYRAYRGQVDVVMRQVA